MFIALLICFPSSLPVAQKSVYANLFFLVAQRRSTRHSTIGGAACAMDSNVALTRGRKRSHCVNKRALSHFVGRAHRSLSNEFQKFAQIPTGAIAKFRGPFMGARTSPPRMGKLDGYSPLRRVYPRITSLSFSSPALLFSSAQFH